MPTDDVINGLARPRTPQWTLGIADIAEFADGGNVQMAHQAEALFVGPEARCGAGADAKPQDRAERNYVTPVVGETNPTRLRPGNLSSAT